MFDSIEMGEVGTQGQGGCEDKEQNRDTNQPRRNDQQSERKRPNQRPIREQDGRDKRQGQGEEEEEN